MSTVDDIQRGVEELVARVRDGPGDEENWHIAEDKILHEALAAIAKGAEDAQTIAREALMVRDIAFSRWYA